MPSRIDLFRAAATERGIAAADVDSWLSAVRLYTHLAVDGDGPVAGRKGGPPRLPRDLPWPTGPDGAPLPHLVTVDCAALPQEDTDIRLPADGHLLFFIDYDDLFMEDHELEQRSTRVLHLPGGTELVERSEPGAESDCQLADLHATIRVSLPEEMDAERFQELTELSREFWPEGPYDERDVRIGGHGVVAHSDPEIAVIGHELPYPDGADVLALEAEAMRDWVPLAQFDLEYKTYAYTNARFVIRRADLAAGDFSRVVSASEFTE